MTAIASIVLVSIALVIISRPLFARAAGARARSAGGGLAELEERYRNALADIQDAQNDWEIGNLSDGDYDRFRDDGRRRAAEALRDLTVYTEQREQLRGQVERELAAMAALRTAPLPTNLAPTRNGHAHVAIPRAATRASTRTVSRSVVLGGGAIAAFAVAGIIFLYIRAVGVQESQAPVGAIPPPVPRAVLVDANGGYWAAKADGLMHSADGKTWQSAGPSVETTALATKNGVPWLGLGSNTAILSNDGGSTWSADGQAPGAPVAGAQEGPDATYAYFAGSGTASAGIFRTQDGQSWEQVSDPVPDRVVGLAIVPGSQGGQIIYLGTGGGIIRSLDGGRTWSSASGAVSLAVTGAVRGIAGDPSRGALYAATSDGIFRTTKDGNEWDRLPFKGGVVAIGARGDRLVAVDDNGHVFVSKSGGVSWTADG